MASSVKKAERWAWAGWALLWIAASTAIILNGLRSTMPIYRYAALAWFDGRRIYELSGIGGFTYFPQSAILLAPFAVLPPVAGEVAWRLVSIGFFASAVFAAARLLRERTGKDSFPLLSLASIIVAWDCARNGQATLLMAGLMLLAMTEAARSRWWLATLWLCLSLSVKPLSIVLILLVAAIDRPMSWRLALGLAVTALVPFLTQRPDYVVEQYRACIQNMSTAAHVGVVAQGWTTPFTGLREFGVNIPEKVQTLLRFGAALGTLALCLLVRKRFDGPRAAVLIYSLAALYLILFSPRTENNTYMMLGPVIGYLLADAWVVRGSMTEAGLLLAFMTVLMGSRTIERLLAPAAAPVWMSPLLATMLAIYFLNRVFASLKLGAASQ